MYQLLYVSTSGYGEASGWEPSRSAVKHLPILDSVRQIRAESCEIYGSRKIARTLDKCPELEAACRTTVQRAAQEWGITSRVRK